MFNIDSFMNRYNIALNSKSKDFRLSMAEADALAREIASISIKVSSYAERIIGLQSEIIKLQQQLNSTRSQDRLVVQVKGGDFKDG